MALHALIIAGGTGQRLGGVRKADLRVGDITLLDRVSTALGPLDTPLMLSTGPGAPATPHPRPGLALPDLDLPIGGPLAGLLAALDSLRARAVTSGILVSVAVDTPFLPPGASSPSSTCQPSCAPTPSRAASATCWKTCARAASTLRPAIPLIRLPILTPCPICWPCSGACHQLVGNSHKIFGAGHKHPWQSGNTGLHGPRFQQWKPPRQRELRNGPR